MSRRALALLALFFVACAFIALACGRGIRRREPAPPPPAMPAPGARLDSLPYHEFVYGGVPRGGDDLKLLKNSAYLAGFDERRKGPAWVAYRASGDAAFGDYHRISRFQIDERTEARIRHEDYSRNSLRLSRGHMAPSYGIYSRFGKDAERETYLMSNVCPQVQSLNAGRWNDLEGMIAGQRPGQPCWANSLGEVWVLCGPEFDAEVETMRKEIEIPDAFYCVVVDVDERTGHPRALAFVMPNSDDADKPLAEYLRSIDEIENATWLDFFWALDDVTEAPFESLKAPSIWPLERD